MLFKESIRIFYWVWIFIVFVSVVDGYLLLKNRDVISDYEQNPVGTTLLAINGGRVWLFLLVKLLGTILACTLLLVIYQRRPGLGLVVAASVSCFQLGLLLYLTCA